MTYFVSYYWESKKNSDVHGFGSAEIYRNKKVRYWKDIRELQEVTENRLPLGDDGHVVILNFQKLRG